MAKILGYNLLGQNRTYTGYYNGAATKVGEYYIGGTGLSERAAIEAGYQVECGYSELTTRELTTRFPIMPDAKKIRFKLVVDRKSHRLLGGQIVSGQPVTGRIDLLTFTLQKGSTVEDLSALSYSSQPYQAFFPAANGIVLAAEEIKKKIES